MILIVDFGAQTTHLIGRRVRELGAKVIITPAGKLEQEIKKRPKGIILSGGPASVYEKGSPSVPSSLFGLGIPILGICYGEQLMMQKLGGKVRGGKKTEYGPAKIKVTKSSPLFKNTSPTFTVWMSHGDEVVQIPSNFKRLATTETIPYAAIANEKKKLYGIQFHPELVHTQFGEQILANFLTISGIKIKKEGITNNFVKNIIRDIKDSLGEKKAIVALSGGVDSSVAALLVHKAIGKNLTAVYIDSGLMRQNETKTLEKVFKKHYQMKVLIVDAKKDFLKALGKFSDPEVKRKAIGKMFINIFEKEALKLKATYFIQGTIYPDVIESAGSKHSKNIKSHHNVGGLPEKMNMVLVEPLRNFYKDEVRKIGKILKLSNVITQRQPFPGPGLAVRIIGPVTEKKLDVLRRADHIFTEEVRKAGLDKSIWQFFAVHTGILTTGVRGDNRAYGETIALRALVAKDAMSAHWADLPYDLLNKVSNRIVNEVHEVNRVVYDITNKPPATMEWE